MLLVIRKEVKRGMVVKAKFLEPMAIVLPDGEKPTLRQLLWLNKWSNKKLADHMGVSPSCVCSWVNGVRHPRIEEAFTLAELFDVPVHDINWWPERS